MKKILVVDDDPDILFIYSHKLSSENYQVEQAKDGQEALDKIKANTYDLVLLDIMLPKRSGVEILQALHDDKTITHKPPVYLLTNLAEDTMIKDCFKLGAVGYIIKSQVQPADLVKEIATYFETSKK